MAVSAALERGNPVAAEGTAFPRLRDPEIVDQFRFVEACFAMASLNPHLAAIAGEPELRPALIGSALDDTLPVLADVADRLDKQADRMAVWNIKAAGLNEIILRDIERNWTLMERLGPDAVHD